MKENTHQLENNAHTHTHHTGHCTCRIAEGNLCESQIPGRSSPYPSTVFMAGSLGRGDSALSLGIFGDSEDTFRIHARRDSGSTHWVENQGKVQHNDMHGSPQQESHVLHW